MDDAYFRQQAANRRAELLPVGGATLTAAVEPFVQQPGGAIEIRRYGPRVAAHPIILEMAAQMADDERDHRFAAVRALGLAYLLAFALLVAQGGKAYYLSPVYPVLFAAGGWVVMGRRTFGATR